MIVGTSLFSDDMDVEDAGFIPLISDGEEPMDLKDSDISEYILKKL